ncbi:MAG TPA: polysaccharide deacetylase family protein [Balneolaceae bacterium]
MNRSRKTPNIKVLMYHRLSKEKPEKLGDLHVVHVDDFRRQLRLIEALNFMPITFEDYLLYREGKLTLPKKPIILTFDDGHLDTFELALPILKEFDMRAVIFVLGNRKQRYAHWENKHDETNYPLMEDQHIIEAREDGFEIGAHSMTHADLSKLGQKAMQREIKGSKESIESLLGESIVSFAYPFGGVARNVISITQQAGFKYGCGVYTGPPNFGDDNFDIRRLAITSKTNTAAFLMRLLTPYEYVEWFYGKMKHKYVSIDNEPELNTPAVNYERTLRR